MIYMGHPDDRICFELQRNCGLDAAAGRKLITRVLEEWGSEDIERTPHAKAAARRRILAHIASAEKAGNWGAVANFEKTLSTIEGTISDREPQQPIDAKFQQAVLVVLSAQTPEEVQRIIASEMERQKELGDGEK
jgi:hypothetical protein